jgi:hypothetical protein
LKDFGSKINELIKKSHIASELAKEIPYVGAPISRAVQNLGYGDGYRHRRGHGGIVIDPSQYEDYGAGVYAGEGEGVYAGGRRMSHADLKHRLHRM